MAGKTIELDRLTLGKTNEGIGSAEDQSKRWKQLKNG